MPLVRRALLSGAAVGLAGATLPNLAQALEPRVPLAATPISRMDTPWWRNRHAEKLARLRQGRVRLARYGDSITQDWEHWYGDRDAVNLGFKGDNTAHLLWRIVNGEADGISPRAAVVLIGANNLGRVRWNAAQTLAGIDAVVAALRQRLPTTGVLLLGMLPSDRNEYATRTTAEVNRGLAARYGAGGDGLTYMDVGHLYVRNGRVDRSQFYDPLLDPPEPVLHPTAQAHDRLAATIEPTLAAMLGERPRQA